MMIPLLDTVKRSLAELGLREGAPVLAAVSGGADSMALLHLLHRAGVRVVVGHFDHQTREGESAADARFVEAAALALGLPFVEGTAPVAEIASAQGESFEMAARRERYAFLVAAAHDQHCVAIATGHHADDQAETLMLRLLRGTSPAGLAGIPRQREIDGVRVLRPLLTIGRAELLAWLNAEGIVWREDATNAGLAHERNRIRHELLPALARDYNPRIAEALNRLATLQCLDDGLLYQLTTEALGRCVDNVGRLQRAAFRAQDPALQHRLMLRLIQEVGGDAEFERVTAAVAFVDCGESGKQIDLGRGATLHLASDHAVLAPHGPATSGDGCIALPVPGDAVGFGGSFRVRLLDRLPDEPLATYCHAGRQVFDADALRDGIRIRRRRPGDRFSPMGMTGTRKLKKILNDLGLTRPERDRQILVESGDTIIWIPGHTVSRDAAITDCTTRFVELCIDGEGVPDEATPPEAIRALSVGGPVQHSTASLCIYKEDIDIDALTTALGVAPTSQQRRGEIRGKRRPAPIGLWALDAPEGLLLEDKLKHLLAVTSPDFEAWDAIAREHRIVLRSAVFLSGWTEGFDVPADIIASIGQRHWDWSLSMYSASGEEAIGAFVRGPAPDDARDQGTNED